MLSLESKIIQFFSFLVWVAMVCVLYLLQCQVQGEDRLTMATMTLSKDSEIMLTFETAIRIFRHHKLISDVGVDIPLFLNFWYFCWKHFSFVELVTVMRISASHLLNTPSWPLKSNKHPRHLLDHLRYSWKGKNKLRKSWVWRRSGYWIS